MSARDFLTCTLCVISCLMIAAFGFGICHADSNTLQDTPSLTVSSVELDVQKDRRKLLIHATLAVRNPAGDRRQLTLPIQDWSVISAKVDGKPAILSRAKGKLVIWHTGAGTSRLELTLSKTVQRIGQDLLTTIPQLTAAPTTCHVHVGGGEFLLLNGRLLSRSKPTAEKCTYAFPAGNLAAVSLRITKEISPRRTDSLRTAGSIIFLQLKDGLVSWESDTELHVAGKTFDSLTLTIPAGMKITRVSSPELRSWTVSEPDDAEEPGNLKLTYRRGWTGKRIVRVQGVMALAAESFWSVPKIGIADFDGHTGRIEISFPKSMNIRPDEFTGLREVVPTGNPRDKRRHTDGERSLAFQFWTAEHELTLVIPRDRFSATADTTTALAVEPTRCRMRVESVITATRYPPWLEMEIPADWTNLQLTVNGRKADWRDVSPEAGVRHLEIRVPDRAVDCEKEMTLRIQMSAMRALERDRKTGIASFPLPVIRLEGMRQTTGRLTVKGADNVDLTVSERKNLQPVASPLHAFRSTYGRADRPGYAGIVTTRVRAPRLEIRELTIARVDGMRLNSEHVMQLSSRYGNTDVLDVDLPISVGTVPGFHWNGGTTQLATPELLQKTKTREYWRLRFDRPVSGSGTLTIALTTRVGEPDGKPVSLPRIQIPAAARHSRLISTEGTNRRALQLVARRSGKKSKFTKLTTLGRTEIPGWARSHLSSRRSDPKVRSVAVYPGDLPETDLGLQISPLNTVLDSAPVVRRIEIASVLSSDGLLKSEATYRVNANAGSVLGVTIPPEVRLLSVTVNGAELTVPRQQSKAVISLPRDGSHSFDVQLKYQHKVDRPSGTGQLQLNPLTMHSRQVDGTWDELPVKHRTWSLRYPRSIAIVDAHGAFRPESPLERTAWLISGLRYPIVHTSSDKTAVLSLRGTGEPGNVTLSYEADMGGWLLRLAAWFAAMLVLWRGRKLPFSVRGPIALGTAVSAALLTLWGPPRWDPCLDGLLAGTVCGSLLWIFPAYGARVRRQWAMQNAGMPRAIAPGRVVAALLALGVLHLGSSNAVAGDVSATVSTAEYHVSVTPRESKQRAIATVQARYALYRFSDEPVTLALPIGPVPIQSATIDGKPAVISSRNGQLHCVVPNKGQNRLTLTFKTSVESSAGWRSLSLPLRPVPSGKVIVQLPAAESHLLVEERSAQRRQFQDRNNAGVAFSVDRCREIVLKLSTKPFPPAAAMLESRCRSQHAFSENGISQTDELTLKVVRGSVRDWSFLLPTDTLLTGLNGPDVSEWRVEDADEKRRVHVTFRRPLTSSTVIEFSLHRALQLSDEISRVTLGRVVSLNGKTLSEVVSVSSQAGIRLKESSLREATRIPPNATRRVSTANPSLLYAYRLLGGASRITLEASRPKRQAQAVALHRVRMNRRRIHLTSRFDFEVSGSPRSKLTIFLPEGFALDSLRAGEGARWSFGEEGTMVFVTFDKPRIGRVTVTLTGSMRRDAAAATAEIVIPSSLDASRISNIVGVDSISGIRISAAEIEGWNRLDGNSLKTENRDFLGDNTALAFLGTQVEPVPIGLKLTPENRPVNAESETMATISTDAVEYSIAARWNGITGSSRVVALTAPNWIAEQLRFNTEEKLQIVRDLRDDVPEGRTRWIVTDLNKGRGEIVVLANAVLPPALTRQNQVHVPDIVLEQLSEPLQSNDPATAEFKPMKRQLRSVGFVNQTSAKLVPPKESKHRPIDPDSMLFPDWVQGYELDADSDQLTWHLQGKPAPVGSDAVTAVTLLTELHADRTYQLTAVYNVKRHSREFLPVRIPDGMVIDAVRVAGKLTRAVTTAKSDSQMYLIPITQPSTANGPIDVELVLSGQLSGGIDNPLPLIGRTVNLPAPQVVSRQENPRLGMTVGQTKWTVRVPEGVRVTPLMDQGESNVAWEARSDDGREWRFVKAGGAPHLMLSTQTERSTRLMWRLLATLLWLAVGVCGWLAVRRALGRAANG